MDWIGLDSDELVWSVSSNMYGKCTSTGEAWRISDKMVDQDVVSWTTRIDRLRLVMYKEDRKTDFLCS